MKQSKQCPKCNSKDLIKDAKVIDRGHGNSEREKMTVATYSDPDAWLFTGKSASAVSAIICADCGYMELYVDSPRLLRQDRA
jgi:predicted nucleic-acid-binding Zn-ribbon protein